MFDLKLVTVWSAPNYCYRCGNVASVLKIDDGLNREYKVFEAVDYDEDDGDGQEGGRSKFGAGALNKKPVVEYFL